jgi:hypothetical protein
MIKMQPDQRTRFTARLLRPAKPGDEVGWAFVVLPKEATEKLPRRGRTSVEGSINGHAFQATLDPDGQLSHWLKIDSDLLKAAGVRLDQMVAFEIAPVAQEPDPEIPPDFAAALHSYAEARRAWEDTTTVARVDWIHWISCAKQAKTRAKRVKDACEMLNAGKKRVCCFDSSGFYSKAFGAPEAASSS